jgi:hypothetical protein
MLPTRLREVRDKLAAKAYSARTVAEDQLLEELQEIDKVLPASMRKSANDSVFSETRMTSPPSDRCNCCGR